MAFQKLLGLASLTAALVLVAPESRAEDTSRDAFSYTYFVAPVPNQVFPDAPTTLDAQIGIYQGFTDHIVNVEMFVDEVSIGSQVCEEGCTFADIELDQGVHVLKVVSDTGAQDEINVYVAEEPPSDTDTGDTGDTGDAADTNEDTGDSEGFIDSDDSDSSGNDSGSKGCEIGSSSSPWQLLALPALLLLPALGRRRD